MAVRAPATFEGCSFSLAAPPAEREPEPEPVDLGGNVLVAYEAPPLCLVIVSTGALLGCSLFSHISHARGICFLTAPNLTFYVHCRVYPSCGSTQSW